MLLLIAAVARSCSRAESGAKEPPDGHHLVPRPLGAAVRGRRRRGAHPAHPLGDPALPRADAERRQPRPGRLCALGGQRGGQVFALVVMVVAACGGHRAGPDRRDVPAGGWRWTWTRCGSSGDEGPLGLAGARVPARGLARDRARLPGAVGQGGRLDRHRRDRARLRELDRRPADAARRADRCPPAHRLALPVRLGRGPRDRPRHPRRPAVGVHVPGGDRGLDADPLLGRLHGLGRRLPALLLLPQLLRLLDAPPGPGGQLRDPDRRLGVRRLRLLCADQLLVPASHGDCGRHEGVRDQRRRRHRPRVRRPSSASSARSTSSTRSTPPASSPPTRAWWSQSAA